MENLKNDLLKLGVTNNQIKVYLALAQKGVAKAGEIVKLTELHRNIVYVCLEELKERRMVSVSKRSGVYEYKITNPDRLIGEQEERLRIAKQAVTELNRFTKDTTPQQIIIYEGQKDFIVQARRAYEIMSTGGTARTLGISPVWHELVGKEIGVELLELQKKKKIKWLALAKKIDKSDNEYIANSSGLMIGRESPLVSDDTNGIEILEDRISIRSFVKPYFIVEIINRQLAENYQRYFDFLWKSSK